MITIESIKIENFRGIHSLLLEPNRKSFAVQGPNASGKSCVVDAIEFGLTGNLSRLAGEGTGDLSVGSHGMHVDSRDNPAAATVTLRLYIVGSKQSFTITRSLGKPSQPKLRPDNEVTRTALARFSKRDEITLTRRQIAKYVLAQATKRSADVQNLLRLDSIGSNRKAFAQAEKKSEAQAKSASSALELAMQELERHVQAPASDFDAIRVCINLKRSILGLQPISNLDSLLFLDQCTKPTQPASEIVVRQTALRDLEAFMAIGLSAIATSASQEIVPLLDALDQDPQLSRAVRAIKLFELGLELADEEFCPLCDAPRALEDLRQHITEKLQLSQSGARIATQISTAVAKLQEASEETISLARPIYRLATALKLDTTALAIKHWVDSLRTQLKLLSTLEGTIALRHEIQTVGDVSELTAGLNDLFRRVAELPDQSATIEATQFLTMTSDRLASVRKCRADAEFARKLFDRARFIHQAYSGVARAELESLYKSVEESFVDDYRSLHRDDESTFTAKLTPDEGKLGLDVEFFGRGLFPPAAYHSEGHQDSMGLCLYLSLMRQVFGDELTLVVLDDVVMSVDSGHRRALCEMLTARYPNTQFIITTHEELWFYQMQSVGLIEKKNARIFQSWSVDHGPVVSDAVETWGQIDEFLKTDNVPSASLALRRHLERVLPQIADALAARPPFRIDGKYDLGELKAACYVQLKETLTQAKEAAGAWKDNPKAQAAEELLGTLTGSVPEYDKESKYVTATIHQTEWAKLVKQDFIPVVNAFKNFLNCFQCIRCNDWLARVPRHLTKTLSCTCGSTHFTLVKPSLEQKELLSKQPSIPNCSDSTFSENSDC